MPPRERKESLGARSAVGEIAFEHALDRARRVLRLDVAVYFAAKRSVGPEASSDINVIALNRLLILSLILSLALLHLAGEQSDIADVVLRARMVAAGEVDVDRTVELDARLTPLCDVLGVALGIGRREPAPNIAGAGDQTGTDRGRLGRKAQHF